MSTGLLEPTFASPQHVVPQLRQHGQVVLSPQAVAQLAGCTVDELLALRAGWQDLPPDNYLKDGGRYRRRRHSCFVVSDRDVQQVPHRPHWQPVEYNALHGGMQRWFEPMLASGLGSG